MSVEVQLVLSGHPHRGVKTITLPGVPREGDTIRDYGLDDMPGPYLRKVKQVIWDTEQGHVEE